VYRSAIIENSNYITSEPTQSKNTGDIECVTATPLLRVKLLNREHLALLDGSASHCFINSNIAKRARALGFKTKTVKVPTFIFIIIYYFIKYMCMTQVQNEVTYRALLCYSPKVA
jgi:hypothetical protein